MVVTVMTIYLKSKKQKPFITKITTIHEHSFNFELNNELLKIDVNNAGLKEFIDFFKFLISMLRKNRNLVEPIILITKALRKKIMHKSQFCNKFLREREQMTLRLVITNSENFA